jgi:hypothetical protein
MFAVLSGADLAIAPVLREAASPGIRWSSVAAQTRYHIDLFTPETWSELSVYGYAVTGFSEKRRGQASKIERGDILLCYLTGRSRFVAALRVTSALFVDHETRIWKSQPFPIRFECELVVRVSDDDGIHLRDVQRQSAQPATYNWIFRGSPQQMPEDDGRWILERLKKIAEESPPAEPGRPRVEAATRDDSAGEGQPEVQKGKERAHVRIQWKLASLGRDMGLRVWVARNDKSATYDGHKLGDLSIDELPFTYDSTTQKTIELIDVLWLTRNRVEAAFEIESTTAIYSGLLRMSDLLALQPNIDIPLYIVAPDERRDLVHREILRPTFTRMETPLHKICRYLPFSRLEEVLERYGDGVRYMRPDFMKAVAEDVT